MSDVLVDGVSRRGFLKNSAAAAAAASLATGLSGSVYAAGSDALKIGVIGCGGRGSGAAGNCVEAALKIGVPVKIYAAGDVFIEQTKGVAKKYEIPAERCFGGLNAYQQVIDSGVDSVILATPPGFRPMHFKAAIEAGKHVFMEKPVAVDPVGIRTVIAAAALAQQKKLSVVAGTQRRHETNYQQTIKQIQDKVIGDILYMSVKWDGGGIWYRQRKEGMADTEYQILNWYHFLWTCGDQICEQHVHNLDVACWVMGAPPVSAYGSGGRQVRKDPGEIWDHFQIEYEFPNGGRVYSSCRHWPGCDGGVGEFALGTKGTANPGGSLTVNGGAKQSFKNELSGYVQEHIDLIKSIRGEGAYWNEGKQVAESTMMAIMGRTSCYTGKRVTWDFMMNKSQHNTFPDPLDLKAKRPDIVVPQPGTTKLV